MIATVLNLSFVAAATDYAKRQGLADLAIRYNPVVRYHVSRTIDQFQRADLSGRRRLSDRLTARTIAAARGSGYGRQFGDRYEDWPLLTKTMVRDAPASFVRGRFPRIPASTSGTTGTPLLLQRSASCAAAEQTFLDRLLGPNGPSWGAARIAVLRGDMVKPSADKRPPFAVHTHFGRRLLLSSVHLEPENFAWYVDALNRFRPQILLVYPNLAINLLRLLEQTGQSIRPEAIITSSEQLATGVRQTLERKMGVPVHDFYGQSERVCFASSSEAESYWFNPAYGRVEFAPAPWYDAGPDRRAVSIIGTTFWNDAMPLVRYDTGDLAIVSSTAGAAELEEIALGLRPFLGIAGRSNEFIMTPDGLRFTGIDQIAKGVDNILRSQIIQEESGQVLVQVLAGPGFNDTNHGEMLRNIRTKMPGSMTFRVKIVDRLTTTPAGKTPFVIRYGNTPCNATARHA